MVEIMDIYHKPLEGFNRNRCDPFSSNRLRHRVSWRGQSNLKKLQGKIIRLKFYLVGAQLYAFEFQ